MRTKTLTLIHPEFGIPKYFGTNPCDLWICAGSLARQVELPSWCKKIRCVLTKTEPQNDEWAKITAAGRIVGVRAQLTPQLQAWLLDAHEDGFTYGYIETIEEIGS